MRIIVPVLSLETGGSRFIYQLANELVDKGHDVEIVLPHKGIIAWPLQAKITRVDWITPEAMPSGDFVLPNFYPTVWPAWGIKKSQVVRLSLGYEPLWVPDAEVARQTYLIGAPIISISEWHRQKILTGTGLESTVIPGGVDTRVFRPQPKLSLSTGKKRIAYILRSKEHGYTWKGSELFWEACQQIASSLPPFEVVVVTPEKAGYTAPFPCQLINADSDEEMSRFYAQADIFVSTSYFEAFSLPPLEAMASGTSVLTTDSGGNREYTRHGQNCLVVSPGNVQELASSLYQLLTQDHLRTQLAQSGHQFAQSWTWRQVADKVESFLQSLC